MNPSFGSLTSHHTYRIKQSTKMQLAYILGHDLCIPFLCYCLFVVGKFIAKASETATKSDVESKQQRVGKDLYVRC